jgi:hypothetical protein
MQGHIGRLQKAEHELKWQRTRYHQARRLQVHRRFSGDLEEKLDMWMFGCLDVWLLLLLSSLNGCSGSLIHPRRTSGETWAIRGEIARGVARNLP